MSTQQVTTGSLQERFAAVMMPNYGTPPVALARGEGCVVWDVDGKSYLDLIGGIAVSALGHGHPAIVAAVSEQVARLAHISNLFLHEGQVVLAERLLGLLGAPDGRVFFANSGTEANEAAFKLVRRMQGPARPVYVAAEGGFHGRSTGSLGLTGKSSIREPFAPFGAEVRFVPFGDADALTAAIGPDCAGVFLEPCLGEGGIVPAPAGYLKAARAACDAAGALLVLDEIQSGIGRTGAWFACRQAGVVPDVLTLAKGLGGGLPIGACIGIGAAATGFQRGDHGSTFGGNPVACAAALAVLDVIEQGGLLENVAQVGAVLSDGLGAISHPLLADVRGSGLWLAMALTSPSASQVEAAAREAGFLVNAVQPDAVRIAPPLILSAEQAGTFLAALPAILDTASAAATAASGGSGGSPPRASTAAGGSGGSPPRARTAGSGAAGSS
jgi:acetylornithine/N-succinyldiaminopimelate aminotransferase